MAKPVVFAVYGNTLRDSIGTQFQLQIKRKTVRNGTLMYASMDLVPAQKHAVFDPELSDCPFEEILKSARGCQRDMHNRTN